MAQKAAQKGPQIDYLNPKGAPAYNEPDSIQWRIFKNQVAMAIGGVCAVLLEFADPRIRSGVWDHSVYKVDPVGRSERTGIAAMVGIYGPQKAARQVIAGVTRMHAKVSGETPGGRAYQALDPELLDWVSATAGYGFMKAYHRFVQPLSAEEQHRYWNSGEDVARLYGVQKVPHSEAEFMEMMEALAPGFEAHPINEEFLEIVQSKRTGANTPKFLKRALARAAVDLLPPLVREKLELGPEYDLTTLDRFAVKTMGRLAERRFDPDSPPAQASVRLGLPANFLWRKPAEQELLLRQSQSLRDAGQTRAADERQPLAA
ncbi:histidine kinase [Pacificimonas flava]|uniref:Histidine kinase n=2 Tax=Pacificimonas TaxID=1960290 RepID=A0A219B7I9_9SPHN|nr:MULTISPECIES: oxygenase MpaB family protein [Pacificimonas]MBZ6378358.1 DUF2236 domain-containing protein [Pacificimonas aurantium]OWV34335.1 histidine kinase [Pacificimonas flava]